MATILLVDDNKYVIDSLCLYLEQLVKNSVVLRASNGKAAIEILQSSSVDLIVEVVPIG